MKDNERIHFRLATLLAMSLGVFAFGCTAPDTDADIDDDDEPTVQEQVACVDTCIYFNNGTYIPPPTNLTVALKTSSGKYLTSETGDAMMATSNTVSIAETFEVLWGDAANTYFFLRTRSGLYVRADDGGNGLVHVNSPTAGPFEAFSIRNLANGKTRVRSFYSYNVSAINGGGGNVIAAANTNPSWYSLTMVDISGAPLTHPLCSTGTVLSRSMSSCVAKICVDSPQCCSSYWDASCVAAVTNVCALPC